MEKFTCEQCHIGYYQAINRPYTTFIGGQWLNVANAPAYVCDVCRHTFFDEGFLTHLEALLDQTTNLPGPKFPPRFSEELPGWSGLSRGVSHRVS